MAPPAVDHEAPVATVVVLAYRARAVIDTALGSLRAQDLEEPFEVVVSASGEDGTAEHVRAAYPEVRVVHSPQRLFPGPARNRGVEAARGRHIAFLPADGRARPDWLRRRLDRHREGFPVVGGAIANGTPRHPVGTAGYLLEYAPFVASAEVLAQHAVPHCLSYERGLYERVGPYPEDVETGEDTLFNQRLVAAGVAIGFEPDSRFEHDNPRSLRTYLRHQYEHGRGLVICVDRHRLSSPTGPPDQHPAKALWRMFAVYPWRRWRYDLKCLRRGAAGMIPAFLALSPLVLAGLWATSAGAWTEWRAGRA